MKIFELANIERHQLSSQNGEDLYSVARSINGALDISSLLIHYEELAPGNYSAKPHSHTKKDEVFFITKGTGRLIVNNKELDLAEGSVVGFKGEDEEVHVIYNNSNKTLSFISIATNPRDDIVNYK